MTLMALWLTTSAHGALLTLLLCSALAVFGVAAGGDGDAGGGADGAGPADAGDGEDAAGASDEPDPNADRAAAAGGDDDDDADLTDDEREREELLARLTPEEREKRARTWNRRQSRQLRTVAPIAERFRDKSGRYLTVDEIDRIRGRAQDQEELEQFFAENPDVLQEVLKRKKGAPVAAAEDVFVDPFADEQAVPFDTATAEGRWFLTHARQTARENFDLKQSLRRLEQAVGSVHERDTQRTMEQIEGTWKNETLAAAKANGLQGEDLKDFVESVYDRFRLARAEKRLDKVDRKQIIDRSLRPFKATRNATDRRAAAGAHARAAHNTTLPRPGNRAAAGPANPNDTNRQVRETIRDSRKSFFQRNEMSAPPGGR